MPADTPESPASIAPLAEISQGPNAFEEFLDRNQKNLVILAILIALGAAALVVFQGIGKSREETAGAALNKAEDLAALQSVVNEHADTAGGRSAMIVLAEKQWEANQQDQAIGTLRKFISSNTEHPGLATARASLGSKLMAQGKSPDAAAVFDEIIADPKARFVAPYALICLGDIAKAAGDLEKAEANYNRAKTEFPESTFADTATKRVAMLKAKAPVEIAPPPKPETPPAGADAAAPTPGAISPSPGITVTPVETPAAEAPAPAEVPAPAPPEAPPAAAPQETPPAEGNDAGPKPAEP
jgi:predicted negative regulator of RcsB-dependent stress response